VREAALAARAPLREALATIERLMSLQPTMERASLAGSTCKRMAMVEAAAGASAEAAAAVQQMKRHYAHAEALGLAIGSAEQYYPALNRMAAELVTEAGKPGWRGFDVAATASVRQNLAERARNDPDFFSVAGLTELRVYEALASRALAPVLDAVSREYSELQRRVSGTHYWRSVHDTARFVLEPYAQRANAAEKKASVELVTLLEGFAWPP
jgi:hypothetical protein